MTGRAWTLSNGLSLLRILLAVPVVALLLSGEPGADLRAALLIAAAAATDYLDGYLARKRGEVTPLGMILDPLADKIGIGAVVVVLAVRGTLPWWFAAAVVGRDLAILGAAAALSRRAGEVPQSNRTGKWTAAVVALTIFVAVLDPGDGLGALRPAIAASAAMLLLSAASYARRIARRAGDHPVAGH